jgi:putative transposase
LDSERFADMPPAQVYAQLLEEGTYLCSIRTMYRVLEEAGQVRERRAQRTHPRYSPPVLRATHPNEVWSWDITKLPGPARGEYFSLYVVMDLYSRYIVGWTVAPSESAELAQKLIRETCEKESVDPTQLTVHADRGAPMTAKSTALLYADLGITPSYSRPKVSNDNPFSEANFKTLKYRPEMPQRFGCLQDAREHIRHLVAWYNHEHYHSSLGLLTPADVHSERGADVIAARQQVLDAAYARFPERFSKPPRHQKPEPVVWLNPPQGVATPPRGLAH